GPEIRVEAHHPGERAEQQAHEEGPDQELDEAASHGPRVPPASGPNQEKRTKGGKWNTGGMARDLASFVKQLEQRGELVRIRAEVDPNLEMGAIADRVSKEPGGGKALLFEQPKGGGMPVLMNAYGSLKRMEMALGVEKEPRGLDAVA